MDGQRLTRLEQIEATRYLFAEYARATDAKALEAMQGLFRADAVLSNRRGEFSGVEAISEYFGAAWRGDPSQKRHFIDNLLIDWISPGRLTASAYFLYVGRGGDRSAIGWGDYRAQIAVDETGRAQFHRIHMSLDVGTDLSTGWLADS